MLLKEVFKPRNKHLNDILTSKKGGAHEAKQGKHASRAKQNQRFRRELKKIDGE